MRSVTLFQRNTLPLQRLEAGCPKGNRKEEMCTFSNQACVSESHCFKRR